MCMGVLPACALFFFPLKYTHVLLACICPCLAPEESRGISLSTPLEDADIQTACELSRGCWQLNPGLQKSSQCSLTNEWPISPAPTTVVFKSLSQGLTMKLTDSARLARPWASRDPLGSTSPVQGLQADVAKLNLLYEVCGSELRSHTYRASALSTEPPSKS